MRLRRRLANHNSRYVFITLDDRAFLKYYDRLVEILDGYNTNDELVYRNLDSELVNILFLLLVDSFAAFDLYVGLNDHVDQIVELTDLMRDHYETNNNVLKHYILDVHHGVAVLIY